MTVYQGPTEDHRVGELRSVANSIEPAFPTAAETLRAIANTLPAPAPVTGERLACRDCGADWRPVRRGECARCGSDATPAPVTGETTGAGKGGHVWQAVGPNAAELWSQCANCRVNKKSIEGGLPCRRPPANPDADDASKCACEGYTIRTDYGTGVEHDVDRSSCPVHGEMDDAEYAGASEGLSEAEREALRTSGSWPNVGRDIFAAVERIVAARVSTAATQARAEERERIAQAIERERSRRWQKHLTDHPYSDAKSCPRDYGEHDALYAAARIARDTP